MWVPNPDWSIGVRGSVGEFYDDYTKHPQNEEVILNYDLSSFVYSLQCLV